MNLLTQAGALTPAQFTPSDTDTTDASILFVAGAPSLAPTALTDSYSMAPNIMVVSPDFATTMTASGQTSGVLGNDTATTNGPMNAVLTSGVVGSTAVAPQSLGIDSATETGDVVTVTTSLAGTFVPGEGVTIAGVGTGYDGYYAIATVLSNTQFTYNATATNMAEVDGSGTASMAASIVITGNTANGTVWLNELDGSFAYTPTPGFVGTDTFTYKAVDALSNAASANTTVTINVGGLLSIPQTLKPVPFGNIVVVPVNLASGNPANSGGLTNATIGINYDVNKLSLPDGADDVAEGALNTAAGWTNFTVNANTPGQLIITTSNTGGKSPLSSTAGGSLAFITFTEVGTPTGTSVVNISGLLPAVTELDVAGTGTSGNSIPLPFAVAPVDNTNFDGAPGKTDGLITFPIGTSTTVNATVGGSSVTTVTYGTPVTLTATVAASSGSSAPPAGSVDFQDDGTDLGLNTSVVTSGTSTIFTLVTTPTELQVIQTNGGIHFITTSYDPGTPNFYPDASGNLASGLAVTPAPLTIKALTNIKTYDGSTSAAAVPTVTGLKGSDTVTGLAETYDNANVGNSKTLSVSNPYTVNDGNGGLNYTVTVVNNTTGVINAGPLSQFVVTILGGNTVVAGQGFLFMVQAEDSFGNPITNNLPSTINFHTTPFDPQGNFPFSGSLLSNGLGFFQGNLKTAGPYSLTVSAGAVSNNSTPFTVVHSFADHFVVSAPPATLTGASLNLAVTAFDTYGNLVTDYNGTVRLTSTDSAFAAPVNNYTFTTGPGQDNGAHAFSVTLNTPGNQTITATDTTTTNPTITGTSKTIVTTGLVVTGFTPTPTGFTATFNRQFAPADLTLYGSNLITVQDVTLRGTHVGPIHGTLLIDPSNQSITFNATSSYLQLLNEVYDGSQSAVLPDDTYTATFVSGTGTNGFIDNMGEHLDGASNFGHANYVSTFATSFQQSNTPALGIPDIARGPDNSTPIKVPNDTSFGIPITLYHAAGVTDVTFTLTYNPALLNISGTLQGSSSDATDPNGTLTVHLPITAGVATFTYHDATPLSGEIVLGDIAAVVPNSAVNLYKTKSLLQIGGIVINHGAVSGAVNANTVLVNAYFGDVTGDGKVDGSDKLSANQVATGQATGFDPFRLMDPVIVGDVANDLYVDAGDVTAINLFEVRLNPPQIPFPPTQLPTNNPNYIDPSTLVSPNAADPTLSLGGEPTSVSSRVNAPVVSVFLDHPHPAGSTGMTEATLALTYDPSILSVTPTDISLGTIPSQGTGWQLNSVVDATTGQIGIEIYSLTPITATAAGSLVNIAFHWNGRGVSAASATTSVQLVSAVYPSGQSFGTSVDDAQGGLILSQGMDLFVVQAGNSVDNTVPVTDILTRSVKTVFEAAVSEPPAQPEGIIENAVSENIDPSHLTILKEETPTTSETGPTHPISAGMIVSGISPFGPNPSIAQLSGQVIQIVSLPLLNSFTSGNNISQIAERLFTALARRIDAPADLDLLSQSNRPWDSSFGLDWLTVPTETPADAPVSGTDQSEEATPDRNSALEKIFADLAGATDDFSDLGDY